MDTKNESILVIKKAELKDVGELSKLCSHTFYKTYQPFNTSENMLLYVEENFSEASLREELTNDQITLFVALLGSKMVGYVKLETVNSSYMDEGKGLEVCRLYVDSNFQKLKIGSKLNRTEDFAFNNGCNYIWLGVWKKNTNAISIYTSKGFEIVGNTTFILGDDVQDDFIMIKKIER